MTTIRSALIGAVFLTLLITSLYAQDATASTLSERQYTVPPNTDTVTYGLYLPQIVTIDDDGHVDDIDDNDRIESGCPTQSSAVYSSLPVAASFIDHPPAIHGDLNLSLRSYVTATVPLTLIDINGPTDSDAPQLAGVIGDGKPDFVGAYQVYQWDWACQGDEADPWYGHGCRGEPITYPPATLLALAATEDTPVRTPSRRAEIHAGGFVALVLYAEERRLTLAYTREDTPARGYVIHLEDICVDPALLQLYQQLDAAGRSWLPALHSFEQVGTATNTSAKAAIRDTGSFMDPRSRKDWWQGY